MKLAASILVLHGSCVAASMFDTILPTKRPTTTDPWECTTMNLTTFFKVPKPTGKVEDAIYSQAAALEIGCTSSMRDELGGAVCTFHAQEKWCAITTAMPKDVLPEYSSYGSMAYSWWAAHSIRAVEFADYCPERWFLAETEVLLGAWWLNETIAMAGCYAGAHASEIITTMTTTSTAARSGATTTGPKATVAPAKTNHASIRNLPNNWLCHAVVGLGLVVRSVA